MRNTGLYKIDVHDFDLIQFHKGRNLCKTAPPNICCNTINLDTPQSFKILP